jgi:hypothetical protein
MACVGQIKIKVIPQRKRGSGEDKSTKSTIFKVLFAQVILFLADQ